MKKVVFIVSHLCSGSSTLIKILNENPRCTVFQSKRRYEHPEDLNWLFKFHKLKKSPGAIYGDNLLYNHSFSCKLLYKYCQFIYLIRPPMQTLNEIYRQRLYSKKSAFNYYCFRLRRICEMAKQTPDGILTTYDSLIGGKCFSIIENYLNLLEPLFYLNSENLDSFSLADNRFDKEIIAKAEDCYEKYFYYLKNLPIKKAL